MCSECWPQEFIEDDFGNSWPLCSPGCDLAVVRPGKVQCECDPEDVED